MMKDLKESAAYILSALKKAGADEAQCIVCNSMLEEFNVDAGEFSLMRTLFTDSASMKVIKNHKKGVIAINKLDEQAIDEAAAECVCSAENSVEDDAVAIAELTENADYNDGTQANNREVFFTRLREFVSDIKTMYPCILIEQLIASYSEGTAVFANTNGVEFMRRSGNYSVSVMYSSHLGEKTTSFNYFDFDIVDPDCRYMDIAMNKIMLERCEKELDSRAFEGKFVGTAVFSPICLGDVLSMIIGNFCGDFTIIDGTSPWRYALGTQVADKSFTLSAIPRDDRIVCGERITDDGYTSENYDIIKDGILESFCLSDYAARKTGLQRSKNSSGAVEVKPGKDSIEKIISGIEHGILVCRFSGGDPATNGDFSGVAKNSFLIENGKIAYPVSETMISGNLAAMLKNIRGFSGETVCDGSSVLPYAAFDGITVSGK